MANEEKTITGTLTYVYATGGVLRIREPNGQEWHLRLLDARYWATGAEYRAFKAALRVQKYVGRQVTAHIEHHSAFGWAIFGGSQIRLAEGAQKPKRGAAKRRRAR